MEELLEQQTNSITSLNADGRKTLKKAILEISDSLTRMSAEKDLQKDILDEMHDKLGVDKKLVRRMAKTYYDSTFEKVQQENAIFEDAYKSVIEQPL